MCYWSMWVLLLRYNVSAISILFFLQRKSCQYREELHSSTFIRILRLTKLPSTEVSSSVQLLYKIIITIVSTCLLPLALLLVLYTCNNTDGNKLMIYSFAPYKKPYFSQVM